MAKIIIKNRIIIETDAIDELYREEKRINLLYKSGAERRYFFDSIKEAEYIMGQISNFLEIPEENKIGGLEWFI